MKRKKIRLKKKELDYLEGFIKKGSRKARAITRARVLILLHNKQRPKDIMKILDISAPTFYSIKNRYLEGGIENALEERPRSGPPKKYSDKQVAEVISLACTDPPQGRKSWSIRLLANELETKPGFETINREVIRLILKKAKQNRG